MAFIEGRPKVEMRITLVLSEAEASALDAIAGYGTDSFLKVFYEHMGKAYLQPYESGLRSLFDSVQHGDASARNYLRLAKECREVASGRKIAIFPENDKPTSPEATAADGREGRKP